MYSERSRSLRRFVRVDLNGSDDFGKRHRAQLDSLGPRYVFEFGGYWRDVGTPTTIIGKSRLLLTSAAFDPYENAAWPTRTLAGPKSLQRSGLASESRVSLDATLTSCEVWMSIVSTGARIDADAEFEATMGLPEAHIGSGAKIRNAIVAEKTVVPPHARIGYDTAADRSQFVVSKKGIVIVCASRARALRGRAAASLERPATPWYNPRKVPH
jgi:ADP-glucose pyrophosphorylase